METGPRGTEDVLRTTVRMRNKSESEKRRFKGRKSKRQNERKKREKIRFQNI